MHIVNSLKVTGLSAAGLLLVSSITFAASERPESDPELFNGGQWFLTLLSLIFVVFLAYWATRFLAGRSGNLSSRYIKVAGSICLGTNRHLYLLLVYHQVLLVGSSEQGITLIKEYNDPAFYEELQSLVNQKLTFSNRKFKDLLDRFLNDDGVKAESTVESSEFKNRLTESLERIRAWKNRGKG
ncbi:MAG TPA: flagellar biosynthetic protein FliO [Bacillota bacterium]